ncbi:snapalysin family zinc-dependent metalloprotease [Streptomyces varsoviensis]|uniref:Extracellular small neutral protease n=1 Tax=Streptomyces varsoviensis TaxID=67373 RepID=A0ABR5J4D8_9ACTN|nr:snapalysin family zinc-dependent metalloprotease [Streptomyces varsoviensis]KOG88001.1 metalloprotease [Streptomyces varsoviensis]
MRKRIAVLTALIPALLSTTIGAASAHPAPPAPPAPRAVVTLTYDASRAGQWQGAIQKAVQIWNDTVHNVRLKPAATPGSADYTYRATSGWPQSTLGPVFPGRRGAVQLGQQAVNEGYDVTRIAAHETGHILGLLDTYNGPCSQLMSGHGPGPSCTNAKPDATEAARVDRNYANRTTPKPTHPHQVIIDIWSTPAPTKTP